MFLFLFLCTVLIPVMMSGIGLLMKKHPPKKINSFYGYRTSRSMKSQETWDFAHSRFSQIWIPLGVVVALVSGAVMFAFKAHCEPVSVSILMIQVIIISLTIIPVEKALKENFDENGKPGN